MEKISEEKIIYIPLSHSGVCVEIYVKESQEQKEVDHVRIIIQKRDSVHPSQAGSRTDGKGRSLT